MRLKQIVVLILIILFFTEQVNILAATGDIVTGGFHSVISGGNTHSLAVDSYGHVFAWGNNNSFQLGIANIESTTYPKRTKVLPGQLKFTAVAAGTEISAALSEMGTVYVWGGVLHSAARELILPEKVAAISAGTDLLLLTDNGKLYVWSYTAEIKAIENIGSPVIAISAGTSHYLALTAAGAVYAWGYNGNGQLGNGTFVDSAAPVKSVGITDIVSVGAGDSHSLAVSEDGTVYAWGGNDYGQLGDGTTNKSNKPIKVDPGLSKIIYVCAGRNFSTALSDFGSVYVWGNGEYGQLGSGTSRAVNSTARVISGKYIQYISAGTSHVLALAKKSTESAVLGWGRNKNKQVGTGKEDSIIAEPVSNMSSAQNISHYEVGLFSGISSWAEKDAKALQDEKLLHRYMLTDYTSPLTRGQLVSFLIRIYEAGGTKEGATGSSPFIDIANSIYKTDIEKAHKLGIISGATITQFKPDSYITREQAAKVLCEMLSLMKPKTNIDMKINSAVLKECYVDSGSISSWAVPYVYFMYEKDLMRGNQQGEFNPAGNMSVEQAIVVVRRMIDELDLIQ